MNFNGCSTAVRLSPDNAVKIWYVTSYMCTACSVCKPPQIKIRGVLGSHKTNHLNAFRPMVLNNKLAIPKLGVCKRNTVLRFVQVWGVSKLWRAWTRVKVFWSETCLMFKKFLEKKNTNGLKPRHNNMFTFI